MDINEKKVADLDTKYLCRTPWGWHLNIAFKKDLFRRSAGKVSVQKTFHDGMYGGRDNALIVAKFFRDAAYSRLKTKLEKYRLRGNKGHHNGHAVITPEEVQQVRTLRSQRVTLREIAEIRSREGKHPLSLKQLSMIATGERWGHLPGAVKKRWVRGTRGYAK